MKRSLRNWGGRLVVAAAVALVAGQVRAQVMQQVPDDAMVVIKVASLSKTSGKIASLSQKMGIAQMVPQLQDPLGALKQRAHDAKGLNDNGDMAFVFVNPDKAGGDKEKSMLVLLPVTDYQAFLGNLQGAKTEGDITEGKFQGDNDTAYVAHWGEYAAVSPSKEVVAKKPEKALQPQGVTAKELNEKDVVVYANFAQIREKAIPELQKNRQRILNELEKRVNEVEARRKAGAAAGGGDNNQPNAATEAAGAGGQQQQQQQAAAMKAVVNQALNVAQQFLQDTRAVTWGVNFADDGIKGSLVAEFEGNSYFGQLAAGAKNTDQSLTSGLPGGSYLFFGGIKPDPARVGKVIDDLTTPVIRDLKTAGVDTGSIEQYVGSVRKVLTSGTMLQTGMLAPSGALGQEALVQSVTLVGGNADQVMAGVRDMAGSMPGLVKAAGGTEDQVKVTETTNAKTVEGVGFDHVQAQVNLGADSPQAAQLQQVLTLAYGPNGINVFAGKVDAGHVLMVGSANEELMAKAVKSAKANDDALGKLEQVKAVSAQLPGNRLGVLYLPIDNLVSTGVAYAKQFGMPVQVQLPPNLPPIGAALSTEGSAYRLDGYVPAQLVQSLVSAGMQAWMGMQGGGAGGGAQPGGPGGL